MRKIVFILIIISLFIGCKTINVAMLPIKNKNYGNAGGKIQVTTDKTAWNLRSGTHTNDIAIIIQNIHTKKKYTTSSIKGYYYFYNLPEGEYTFIKWTIWTQVNDLNVSMEGDIKDFNFIIETKFFKTLKNIKVKVEIPKDILSKNKIFTYLEDEDLEEIQADFQKKDPKGYWNEFTWKRDSEPVVKEQKIMTDKEISDNYIALSDNDYISMEKLYKNEDYYFSFLLFTRITENLLKAYYVKQVDKNVPKTDDLREIIKKTDLKLTADQVLLLTDLNNLNERINAGEDDENFQAMFTKEYFESYLKKIKDFREFIKKLL
jgi:hypothetical protein